MELYLFAVLPLALLSLFDRDRTRSTAGFGWLAALAPVVAKGIGSLIGNKQKKSAEKQAEEARRLEAQRADELERQSWEAQQNSPSAQGMRFKNTLQLGRLAGAMGGLDKLPPSIANYYQSLRKMPEYGGTSSYIPTPKKGGGGWDFAGGVLDALSYLDTDQLKAGRATGQTPSYNPRASSGGGAAAMAPEASAGSATAPITGLLSRLDAGYKPFDPRFGGR